MFIKEFVDEVNHIIDSKFGDEGATRKSIYSNFTKDPVCTSEERQEEYIMQFIEQMITSRDCLNEEGQAIDIKVIFPIDMFVHYTVSLKKYLEKLHKESPHESVVQIIENCKVIHDYDSGYFETLGIRALNEMFNKLNLLSDEYSYTIKPLSQRFKFTQLHPNYSLQYGDFDFAVPWDTWGKWWHGFYLKLYSPMVEFTLQIRRSIKYSRRKYFYEI